MQIKMFGCLFGIRIIIDFDFYTRFVMYAEKYSICYTPKILKLRIAKIKTGNKNYMKQVKIIQNKLRKLKYKMFYQRVKK
jgi:hypothetical protein